MTVEFVAFISSRPVLKTTNWVSPVGVILISSDRKFSTLTCWPARARGTSWKHFGTKTKLAQTSSACSFVLPLLLLLLRGSRLLQR